MLGYRRRVTISQSDREAEDRLGAEFEVAQLLLWIEACEGYGLVSQIHA